MRLCAILSTLLLVAACHEPSNNPDDLAMPPLNIDGGPLGMCAIQNPTEAQYVPAQISSDPAPAAIGGSIVDGAYVLTADTLHDLSTDMALPAVEVASLLKITNGTFSMTTEFDGSTDVDCGTFTTSGNELDLHSYTNGPEPAHYSATSTTLTLVIAKSDYTLVETFTKQ